MNILKQLLMKNTGLAAGDAPENAALTAYINNLAATQKVQLYIDVHSYSQYFMTRLFFLPSHLLSHSNTLVAYGYSCSALTTNNAELQSLAKGTASAIQAVYGTSYVYGPICTTIYAVSGGSVDYVQDVTGGKYVFTIELRDTGRYGFVLPPAQILATGLETWAGFKYLLANIVA